MSSRSQMPLPASSRRSRLSAHERHHSSVFLKYADPNLPLLTLYRDVKMQNILLTAKGVLKIGTSGNPAIYLEAY